MKIAFDAREAAGSPAGKGQVVAGLLPALTRIDREDQFYVFLKDDIDIALPANAEKVFISAPSFLWHVAALRKAKELGVDLYVSPTSFIVPAISRIPSLIVVHDMVVFKKVAYHQRKARIIERITLRRAVRNARMIVAVSEHTAKDLVSYFPESAPKTTVIYSANPQENANLQSDCAVIQTKYKLPEKFILYVGTLEPRKNPQGILHGYAAYRKKAGDHAVPLVLAGKPGWHADDFSKQCTLLGIESAVHFTGYVPQKDLGCFYRLASCFLFPSLYEGFGLIVLEALQLGCPVITSGVSALPEAGGDAAHYVDPRDYEAIGNALYEVVTNPGVAADMREKGYRHSAKFTWQHSAEAYKNLIHKELS